MRGFGRSGFAVLVAGFALFACEKTSWNEVVRLPRDFRHGAVLALGPNEGLIAGRIRAREGNRFVTKEAVIFRVHGRRTAQVFSRPNADVFSLSAYAATRWALMRLRDSEGKAVKGVMLLASTDGGTSWKEVGPVPGHPTQILSCGSSQLWALGPDTLYRSTDGGSVWSEVASPGAGATFGERVVIIDERHVGVIGPGIRLFDRESGKYVRHLLEGMDIDAADGRFIVAREKNRQRIGLLDESLADVQWRGAIDEDVHPFDLAVSGERMWMLALPQGESLPLPGGTGRGVHLFASKDGGQSWSSSRVRSGAWHDDVDIGPDGAGIGVGYENEVWLAGP